MSTALVFVIHNPKHTYLCRDSLTFLIIYMFPGHYLYVSIPNQSSTGQRALLVSPTHSATTGSCLRWWYRVERDSDSTLSVQIRRQGSSQRLWSQSAEATNAWRVKQLTINSNSRFEVSVHFLHFCQECVVGVYVCV